MFERFRRRGRQQEQKASVVGSLISLVQMGKPVWTKRDYEKLAREAYERNVIAFRCVQMVAEAAASTPLVYYMGDDEADDLPAKAIITRPNAYQSSFEFISEAITFLLLSGNEYMEFVLVDGQPKEAYNLRPDRVRVIPGPKGYPRAFEYNANGRKYEFEIPDQGIGPILHVRTTSPIDDWYGYSAVGAAAFSIDVHNEASSFNKALLGNSARPSGALVHRPKEADTRLTDEQFARLKEEMADKYSGASNAGRPLLLDGGLDWIAMGQTMADMQFLDGKRESAREIALAFGVPPMLLGIPGDNTYSNYREANVAFYRQTVIPILRRLLTALAGHLDKEGALRIEPDLDQVEALSLERERLWDRVTAADCLSFEEKRAALGYPPEIPKDHTVLVPASSVPIEDVGFVPGGPEPTDDE